MRSSPKPISLPLLSEREHPIIAALMSCTDQELLRLWKQHPDRGQYFTALFCRHAHLVYSLLAHQASSPLQVDYLFAKTWQSIFRELSQSPADSPHFFTATTVSLQSWILNHTAAVIHQQAVPGIESIHYLLSDAPPPLWCYLEVALSQLPALPRFMVLMSQTFHWSEHRIAAYLQAEGEDLSVDQLSIQLQQSYQLLQDLLPGDIQSIYLDSPVEGNNLPQPGS
jgi:hypothetical protein